MDRKDIPNQRTPHILVSMQDTLGLKNPVASGIMLDEALAQGLKNFAQKYNAVVHIMFETGSEPYALAAMRAELSEKFIQPAGLSDQVVFANGVFKIDPATDPVQLNTAHEYSTLAAGKKVYGSKSEAFQKLANMWEVGLNDMILVSNDNRLHAVPKRLGMKVFKSSYFNGKKPEPKIRDMDVQKKEFRARATAQSVPIELKPNPGATGEGVTEIPEKKKPSDGWRNAFRF